MVSINGGIILKSHVMYQVSELLQVYPDFSCWFPHISTVICNLANYRTIWMILGYYMVVSMWLGVPPNGWFTKENPNLKWMMTGGTPISGNFHM